MSRFELKPSVPLAAALVAAHAAAGASLYLAIGGAAGALLAAALCSLGAAAAWSRALLRAAGSVRAIEVGADGATLELAAGDRFEAQLGKRRYVSRLLVTLPVHRPARRTILVTCDMLDPESFRRLRLWALWDRLPVARGQLTGAAAPLH